MNWAVASILSTSLMTTSAVAADIVAPAGWVLGADGSYTHGDSGVVCPKTIGSYNFVRLDGPAEPNLLGTCFYSGGKVRVGEIRIRKFVDGVGDTPLAIQNDRTLMGQRAADVPADSKAVSAMRLGPGPVIDGNQTSQYVMTRAARGLLVDCISQTKRDKSEFETANTGFTHPCMFGN